MRSGQVGRASAWQGAVWGALKVVLVWRRGAVLGAGQGSLCLLKVL